MISMELMEQKTPKNTYTIIKVTAKWQQYGIHVRKSKQNFLKILKAIEHTVPIMESSFENKRLFSNVNI